MNRKWLNEEIDLGTTRRYWLLLVIVWAADVAIHGFLGLVEMFA